MEVAGVFLGIGWILDNTANTRSLTSPSVFKARHHLSWVLGRTVLKKLYHVSKKMDKAEVIHIYQRKKLRLVVSHQVLISDLDQGQKVQTSNLSESLEKIQPDEEVRVERLTFGLHSTSGDFGFPFIITFYKSWAAPHLPPVWDSEVLF